MISPTLEGLPRLRAAGVLCLAAGLMACGDEATSPSDDCGAPAAEAVTLPPYSAAAVADFRARARELEAHLGPDFVVTAALFVDAPRRVVDPVIREHGGEPYYPETSPWVGARIPLRGLVALVEHDWMLGFGVGWPGGCVLGG